MEITYNSSDIGDQWRCQTTMLFGRPQGFFVLLIFPLIMTFCFGHDLLSTNIAEFAALLAGASILWTGFFFGMLWVQIRQRCGAPRICTTRLAPEGVFDITPDKTTVIPWREVSKIHNSGGDIFLYRAGINGVYVPRGAFTDHRAGDQFFAAAQAARKGDFSQLTPAPQYSANPWDQAAWPTPAAPSAPAGVWPPPPSQTGYSGSPYPVAPGQVDWSQVQDQAKRDSKKQQFQMLRTVFIVPMVITGMNHGHIAPGRAHIVLIFDLSVFTICIAGLIGIWIAESRLKRP